MKLLTVTEVAKLEKCSPRRIRQIIKAKRLIGVTKHSRNWLIEENYIIIDGTSGPKRNGKKEIL